MSKKMSLSMKLGVSSIALFLSSMAVGIALKMTDPKKVLRECGKDDVDCQHARGKIQLAQDSVFIIALLLLGASISVHSGKMEGSKSMLIGLLLLIVLALQYKIRLPFSSGPLIESHAQYLISA